MHQIWAPFVPGDSWPFFGVVSPKSRSSAIPPLPLNSSLQHQHITIESDGAGQSKITPATIQAPGTNRNLAGRSANRRRAGRQQMKPRRGECSGSDL